MNSIHHKSRVERLAMAMAMAQPRAQAAFQIGRDWAGVANGSANHQVAPLVPVLPRTGPALVQVR